MLYVIPWVDLLVGCFLHEHCWSMKAMRAYILQQNRENELIGIIWQSDSFGCRQEACPTACTASILVCSRGSLRLFCVDGTAACPNDLDTWVVLKMVVSLICVPSVETKIISVSSIVLLLMLLLWQTWRPLHTPAEIERHDYLSRRGLGKCPLMQEISIAFSQSDCHSFFYSHLFVDVNYPSIHLLSLPPALSVTSLTCFVKRGAFCAIMDLYIQNVTPWTSLYHRDT